MLISVPIHEWPAFSSGRPLYPVPQPASNKNCGMLGGRSRSWSARSASARCVAAMRIELSYFRASDVE